MINPEDVKSAIIPVAGITFEGPLFHRSIIEKIGYPEKKFFIYGDDTEFIIRAEEHGAKAVLVRDAILNRRLPYTREELKFTWKHKYIIRNIIAIDVLHGKFLVRLLRPFAYFAKWLSHCRNFTDFKVTIGAFLNGYFYKSDN